VKVTDEGVPVDTLIGVVKDSIRQAGVSRTAQTRDLQVASVQVILDVVASKAVGGGLDISTGRSLPGNTGPSFGGRYWARTSDLPVVRGSLPGRGEPGVRDCQSADLRKGLQGTGRTMLTAVPDNAGLCRFIRGDFVGKAAADPELWDFCGGAGRREAASSDPCGWVSRR